MPEKLRGAQKNSEEGVKPSSLIHGPDLWVAGVLLAFSGTAWYLTTTFEEVAPLFANNIGPEWFPRLMIGSIVALSLIIPFEHLFVQGGRQKLDSDRGERVDPMTLATAALLLLVVMSIAVIGMALATVATCALLPILWGERRAKVLVPYAILFPAAIALLFSQILKIYFEPGLIGFSLG